MKSKFPLYFLIFAISSLLLGILFGLLASLQYLFPDFLKEYLPFSRLRPLHVTSVISWIILGATGIIYYFLNAIEKLNFYSEKLIKTHLIIYLITGISIYISYFFGYIKGREYLAFAPFFVIPILVGWALFGINYFKMLRKNVSDWPVYYWMWGTGIVFMFYHLCEAHLWILDYFRRDFIKDMTVQWKSYGSFIGSWNMLVYGISIYVMTRIKNDTKIARSKTAFFFYFLGLTNLMFGWAHHTYILPTQPWIRYVAYGVSMTEWLILGSIIYNWKKSLPKIDQENHPMATRFIMATEFWIFLNLVLAILFSIPAINFFTHGTHITVAHSMGTTIGINTTILFSALLFIVVSVNKKFNSNLVWMKLGFWIYNLSLFFFWCSLLIAGFKRSYWMYGSKGKLFSEMQDSLLTVYVAIMIFGVGIVIAISMISIPILKQLLRKVKQQNVLSIDH